MMLREKIIEQCLQAMKRDDVKKELKQMFHPVIDMIMQEIYPYIYLSVVFVMISFLMTLGIFVLLMRTAYFKPIGWIVRVLGYWGERSFKMNVIGWPQIDHVVTGVHNVQLHESECKDCHRVKSHILRTSQFFLTLYKIEYVVEY